MELIESSVWDEGEWHERAEASGLDPAYLADSLYGDPPKTMEIDGIPATATSIRMACYAKAIFNNWRNLSSRLYVLELGGGYGAMAHSLGKRYGIWGYYVLDADACVQMQIEFTRNTIMLEAEKWNGEDFDIAINTHSFGEMDPDDVSYYFGIIKDHLREGGALYINNRIRRVTDFEQYPYGAGWRHVFMRHPFEKKEWIECLSIRDRSVTDTRHPIDGARLIPNSAFRFPPRLTSKQIEAFKQKWHDVHGTRYR